MKECKACKRQIADYSMFCPYCGNKTGEQPSAELLHAEEEDNSSAKRPAEAFEEQLFPAGSVKQPVPSKPDRQKLLMVIAVVIAVLIAIVCVVRPGDLALKPEEQQTAQQTGDDDRGQEMIEPEPYYVPEIIDELIVSEGKKEDEPAMSDSPQLSPGGVPVTVEEKNLPNIIVIMNESFADFNIFANKPVTNIPVTPYIDSLHENTIKGYALSSVFGGNTANSEFELLTGHSLAFLPSDSVAYQQYISEDIYSMAWLMRDLGYATYATHPYYASGWSREVVYPMLGFEEFTFLEDYEEYYPQHTELLREYVSDKAMFSHVLDKLNSKEEGQPLFVMGITMQNHGGYLYEGDNYIQTVQLLETEDEYRKAEQYLSVIHETDMAVEFLLTELGNYPEDTIVLFFSDHFPKVETEFYTELNGGPFNTLENKMLQYKIPFFIWANYDIPEQTVDCTSISYLGRYLLENAGLELPAYYSMLKDIEQLIPAINAYGYYSKEQARFIPVDEATDAEKNMLLLYQTIQYNNLHDKEHRSEELYGQYMHEDALVE